MAPRPVLIANQPRVSAREIRRQLSIDAGKAQAALQNEELTRSRVDTLEGAMATVAGILARGFWGRLTWLIRGK